MREERSNDKAVCKVDKNMKTPLSFYFKAYFCKHLPDDLPRNIKEIVFDFLYLARGGGMSWHI